LLAPGVKGLLEKPNTRQVTATGDTVGGKVKD
jgi:hypothetical protein